MTPLLAVLIAASQAAAPSPAADKPTVALETSMGRVVLALDKAKAPLTVENFLAYVRSGHYDGTVFHRVIPGFMAQGGGMDAQMKPRATRPPVKNESGNGLSNRRGTIAMARTSDPDSATAQFFVNVVDNGMLDAKPGQPGYAVFGEVTEGMDVVDRIVSVPTGSKGMHQNVPLSPVVIKSARIVSGAPAAAPTKGMPNKPRPRPRPSPSPSN